MVEEGVILSIVLVDIVHVPYNAITFEMELADKAVGFLLSLISLSIFTYYTFWVIILPFVDRDHFIHKYFLAQEYAILIPVFAGVALFCLLCVFIGKVRCHMHQVATVVLKVARIPPVNIFWSDKEEQEDEISEVQVNLEFMS
ncbi:hypothetical protein IFM89_036999 [Coptis chinensis]|uniref:Dolichol phosphate-mannose biosynthesis regulatory protein n=1 Tax=Coptis chinensis TaxID=261450 RepID=A0A835HJD9_9MAGN|nr:hypothetical protein IFM89_036999 [Coptis chinensis]